MTILQSSRVTILVNNDLDFNVKSIHGDKSGNLFILNFKTFLKLVYDTNITLVCIHGSDNDKPEFYNEL